MNYSKLTVHSCQMAEPLDACELELLLIDKDVEVNMNTLAAVRGVAHMFCFF